MTAIRNPKSEIHNLFECTLCPRNCRARRGSADLGYCRTGLDFDIAAICRHRGEEPVLTGEHGICNIFFAHCNLQCLYCQNYQISRNDTFHPQWRRDLETVVGQVEKLLDAGARCVGFVSASHCIPQMQAIIVALRERGRSPAFVFNTNAYDKTEVLKSLAEMVDVYLPDFKYADGELAERYSGARDYPEVARASLKEMYRQKGAEIELDAAGVIRSGLIIRHLILPGQVENSLSCLRFIAAELSPAVHVSLLAQYRPTPEVAGDAELGRPVREEEYGRVKEELEKLGFERGWVQALESRDYYSPDFNREGVFEE